MKMILFSGFLGAGKTVSILSLADWILRGAAGGKKPSIVIIENEIGDVAYDKTLLESRGLAVKNLLSGCICCTLSTDLPVQLKEIRKQYDPDYIIIEPTGAAFPDRIKAAASYARISRDEIFVITIVDVTRVEKLKQVVPHLIENQIQNADFVLLSKTDLAQAGALAADTVEKSIAADNTKAASAAEGANPATEDIKEEAGAAALRYVRALNDSVPVDVAPYNKEDTDALWKEVFTRFEQRT